MIDALRQRPAGSRLAPRGRVAVMVALGAWLVHQLRYALAHGAEAHAHAHAHSHQYLDFAGPLLILAVALATASWVLSLGRATDLAGRPSSVRVAWLRASLALVLVYCVQESIEGLLAPGHPDVLGGIFGSGGWLALPLSVLVGAVIALALRGARAARAAVAHTSLPRVRRGAPRHLALPLEPQRSPRSHVLATKLAGRAPPLVA